MHIKWTPSTCESVARSLRIAAAVYERNAKQLIDTPAYRGLIEAFEQSAGEAIHLAEWLESDGSETSE